MTYQGPDEDRDALEALGRAVRFARQQSSLTQRTLEALTGVDQTAISRMERGVVPGMGLVRFARIAMVLRGNLLVMDAQRAGRHTTGGQLPSPDINGDVDRGSHDETEPGGRPSASVGLGSQVDGRRMPTYAWTGLAEVGADPTPQGADPTPQGADPTPQGADPTPQRADPTPRGPDIARSTGQADL
jgi:hypothetical protein